MNPPPSFPPGTSPAINKLKLSQIDLAQTKKNFSWVNPLFNQQLRPPTNRNPQNIRIKHDTETQTY